VAFECQGVACCYGRNRRWSMSLSELLRHILWRGIDDWVDMCEVASVARKLCPTDSLDERRERCIRAIGELREGGYARVGDVTSDGFMAWTGETSDVLHRIDKEWRRLITPNLWQIAWLENTPSGDQIGRSECEKWKKQTVETVGE
jgi:hypothetical protein